MSILVISPKKELKIKSDSFQTNRTKIVHMAKEIVIIGFRLKGTPIIIDQISRDKLLQPNKRYALIGNCLEEGKEEMWRPWRPCGVFRLPEELPLQRVKDYIRDVIKIAVHYPRNTYYLRNKDIAKLGLIQTLVENNPEEKEIELPIGETALQLCLSKNTEIKLDINDEENREQVERLFSELAYLDCKYLQKFFHSLAKEIIEQMRKNYAKKVTDFFERHPEQINWRYLSRNPNISEEFFEKYLENVKWTYLSKNPNISEEFFEKYLENVNWDYLSENPNISEEFFERHLGQVNWSYLSENPNISEEFFERHLESVSWNELSRNTNIPEEFFERHLERVNWRFLSKNPNISEEFFERYLEQVIWNSLSRNPNISEEFFERHLENVDWPVLSNNPNISEEFFERYLEQVIWNYLSKNPNISEEFFERHLERISWSGLAENPNIPVEFFERHLENVNWIPISDNPNIPVEFFEQHLEKVNWYLLSENPNIPVEFFEQYVNVKNLAFLSKNKFLYNKYALMNAVKQSDLFPKFSHWWKKEAIKTLRMRLN
jgi:hypothetical protein